MSRYLIAVIVALVLALAGSGWLLKRAWAAEGAYTVQIHSLQEAQKRAAKAAAADRALLARRAKEIAAMERKMASARQDLAAALLQNRAWAEQPVPKEVADALSNP